MMKRLLLICGAEALLALLLAAIPLAVNNTFVLGLLTLLTIYAILLIGLDITVGYLGQINLAQAAFLGLGAYTAALAVTMFGCGMLPALAARSRRGVPVRRSAGLPGPAAGGAPVCPVNPQLHGAHRHRAE